MLVAQSSRTPASTRPTNSLPLHHGSSSLTPNAITPQPTLRRGRDLRPTLCRDLAAQLHTIAHCNRHHWTKLASTSTSSATVTSRRQFNHLRQMHHDFSTLLARTGVTWEMEPNKVNAPNEEGITRISRNMVLSMTMISSVTFNSSTATGKLSHASTQEPPNSYEEKVMEGDFFTKGIHINVFDDEKDDMKGLRHKRKEIFSLGECCCKEGKTSNKEMLDKIVSIWSDSMSQRTTTSRAREERYKGKTSQATSPISDPYSTKACMELLDIMQDVSTSAYFKLMEKFTIEHWRQMFIVMDAEQRKQLIESLVEHWRQMFIQSVYVMCLNLFNFIVVDMSLNSSDDSSSSIDSELDDYDDLMDLVLIMTIMTSMLTGKMYTIKFLIGHETRCYENFWMKKYVFMNFCETLKEVANLCDEQQGVNQNQAVEMAQVRQTITNEMWENYCRS
ncbi:hypothetical protein HKD37_18G050093 [Glycine soja]